MNDSLHPLKILCVYKLTCVVSPCGKTKMDQCSSN